MKSIVIALLVCFYDVALCQNPYSTTAKAEVKKEADNRSEFSKKFPNLNIMDWHKGMKFMVDGNHEESLYPTKLSLSPYGDDNTDSRLKLKDYAWKIFEVDTIEEREVKCPRGKCTRNYVIFVCEGKRYQHEISGSREEIRKQGHSYDTEIRHLFYTKDIDVAKEHLVGKRIWVITKHWMREEDGHPVYQSDGLKYVPVDILDVGYGEEDKPVRIVFKHENKLAAFLDVCMSNINVDDYGSVLHPSFDDCFMMDNPKLKYKGIPSAHWTWIHHGRVVVGMSPKAARLAWGEPKDINYSTVGKVEYEQWVYSSSYLYFENDVLKSIQE